MSSHPIWHSVSHGFDGHATLNTRHAKHFAPGVPLPETRMHIAIDIDDTITHAPEFFSALTNGLTGATITIVTVRGRRDDSEQTLRDHQIRYDRLILSDDPELGRTGKTEYDVWKAGVINQLRPDVFFDDSPEILHRIEPPIRVFMCCDGVMQGWLAKSLGR
jgi:hypothetical protein